MKMYQKQYFVPKTSGTYAETLEAYGLAIILDEIFKANDVQKPKVKIQDAGNYYVVSSRIEITEEMVKNTPYFDPFPYIKIKKDKSSDLPNNSIDYENEKEIYKAYNEFRKSIANLDWSKRKEAIESYENKPHFDYDIFSQIQVNSLGGYLKAYNNVFTNRDLYVEFLNQILFLYSSLEDNSSLVNKYFAKMVKDNHFQKIDKINSLQFFNPHQGKGVNSGKANSISLSQVSAFWLREYLKMAGCYKSMFIKRVKINNQKWDLKFYVIAPKSLDLSYLSTVYNNFKPTVGGNSTIKLDIISILRYEKTLIEYMEKYQQDKPSISKKFKPHQLVFGIYTAYQKNLGQNNAISNIGCLNFPDFISISSFQEGKKWINIIDEHIRIINRINEDIGSTTSMLYHYRRFLSGGTLDDFFAFNFEYTALLMRGITIRFMRLEPFTLGLMEEFITSADKNLKPILDNEGFKNIAKAIRNSTISEQYRKIHSKQEFEICYGMAQDLKRKSPLKEDLISYLSEFIAKYNAETARYAENHQDLAKAGKIRATIKMQDIEEIVKLIDEYGSDVVGKLLSAYGYALDRKSQSSKSLDSSE